MIVAFEGIDGAGKTTTSELVFRRLEPQVPNLRYHTRKSVDFPDPYVQGEMKRLAELLWSEDIDQQGRDPFGSEFWALLMASWFAAMRHNRLAAAANEGVHLITDSWYFRTIAKMGLEGLDRVWLHSLFKGIPTPDLVILLDIEPDLAWQRREHFKVFETGGWQLAEGDEYTRFCRWQERVRRELLSMAKPGKWLVVEQSAGRSAECVASTIADHVLNLFRTMGRGELRQGEQAMQDFDEAIGLGNGLYDYRALAYSLLGQDAQEKPEVDRVGVKVGLELARSNGHSRNSRSSIGR